MLSFHQLSQWMRHGFRFSILKPNNNQFSGSVSIHRNRRNFGLPPVLEKMMVVKFWGSECVILTNCIPQDTTVMAASYKDVLRTKFLPALQEKWHKGSSIKTILLLIRQHLFKGPLVTVTLNWFLMFPTHLKDTVHPYCSCISGF